MNQAEIKSPYLSGPKTWTIKVGDEIETGRPNFDSVRVRGIVHSIEEDPEGGYFFHITNDYTESEGKGTGHFHTIRVTDYDITVHAAS